MFAVFSPRKYSVFFLFPVYMT